MNAALFTKSTTGLILTSGLIAASSLLGHAQDAPFALGAQATNPLIGWYATTPTGQAALGGHTFDMTGGNFIALANGGSASFTGSAQNAKAVYLLLNTSNTQSWYSGSVVGTVVLTFSDGTTQSTDLTIGANLREWRTGAAGVVSTVTDPASSEVWTTTAQATMGGGTAVLDMLTVPVVASGKTLTGVTLTDTNGWGNLQMQISGLTADFTPPAPTPTPTPTPKATPTPAPAAGSGHKDDNAGGSHPGHPGDIDRNAGEKSDKTDGDAKPAATKPATKPAGKKGEKNDKEHGNRDRHGND
jgi:hypothetical protein